MPIKIEHRDVEVVAFRRGKGPGGQNKNKVATSVRMTHRPSGIVVQSTRERTLGANKDVAWAMLAERLNGLANERRSAAKQAAYDAKPDASFSSQYVRTYHLPERVATDHGTGLKLDASRVLNGGVGPFLQAAMRASM